ncbi:MAG: DegT/DnrJ/EryC1/StrS family aminotransferase [Candidatus Cloacimonetes bacterium]|nr:DegT/DnrJ/EryC1/StrS family aminotransferase [Candidatus Cloacimonadota bacterium]
MIPVFRPFSDGKEIEYLKAVLDSGWWGMGSRTREFEEKFAAYIGRKYAIGLNSATAALDLAFKCIDIRNREVITTPMTFVSTNHAILYNQGIPVFCDIEPDTLNIDASRIEALVTERTKAIIVVHYGGYACAMDEIMSIADKYNLYVVEDCAHACGGEYRGRKLGSIGQAGCFSFQAVKNLSTGDGGMLVTDDPEWYDFLQKYRWVGITKDTFSRDKDGYDWFYDVVNLGHKFHMNDITAAIGLAQFEKLAWMNRRRQELTMKYNNALRELKQVEIPPVKSYMRPSYHNYVIKTEGREDLRTYLRERDISTGVHYYPNHLYEMYKPYYRRLEVVETIWKKLVTLPLFPDLKEQEQDLIINSIKDFFAPH